MLRSLLLMRLGLCCLPRPVFAMGFLCAVLLLVASASVALAQSPRVPEIIIPSRPDVPVFMNGTDVSWSVVEGDFGLDRPGQTTPTVIYRPISTPYFFLPPPLLHYFPTSNERPGYGRLEIEPPPDRPLPPPAESFRQGWHADSAPLPANDPSSSFAPGGVSSPNGTAPGSSYDGMMTDPGFGGAMGPRMNGSMTGPWLYGSPPAYGYPPFQGYGYNGSPAGPSFGRSRDNEESTPAPADGVRRGARRSE